MPVGFGEYDLGPVSLAKLKDSQKLISARGQRLARVICQDDFRDSQTSYNNDALGYAYRDSDVLFGPNATFRCELGGDGTTYTGVGGSNPGILPSGNGVIGKRRITGLPQQGVSGKYV